MDEEEVDSLQNKIIGTLGQVVKTCRLGEQIDVQQFLLAVEKLIEDLQPGDSYDMMELFEFLHDQGVAKEDIDEVFLVFKEREAHIGAPILLPIYVEAVPDSEKEKILAEYQERIERLAAAPVVEAPPPPEKKVQEIPQFDKHLKRKRKRPVGLFIFTAMVIAGGAAFGVWLEKTKIPPPVTLNAAELALELPCKNLRGFAPRGVSKAAICRLSKADFQRYSKEEFRLRARTAQRQLKEMGYQRMIVMILETNRVVPLQSLGE